MPDLERLLSEYIAEHRTGGIANPRDYLERVEGAEREELAELIDAYLARSPGRPWDTEAFADSPSERLAEALERSLAGRAGLWPVVLRRLRERAAVKRGDLVRRLATGLGFPGREEKVAAYYHEMEQGLLSSTGVSTRVLEALAAILGTSAELLRGVGEPFGAGPGPAEGPVFARTARPAPGYAPGEEQGPATARRTPEEGEWDEIDELFRGGG